MRKRRIFILKSRREEAVSYMEPKERGGQKIWQIKTKFKRTYRSHIVIYFDNILSCQVTDNSWYFCECLESFFSSCLVITIQILGIATKMQQNKDLKNVANKSSTLKVGLSPWLTFRSKTSPLDKIVVLTMQLKSVN